MREEEVPPRRLRGEACVELYHGHYLQVEAGDVTFLLQGRRWKKTEPLQNAGDRRKEN